MGREEVTWQLQPKQHNEVSGIQRSCSVLDGEGCFCRELVSREGQRDAHREGGSNVGRALRCRTQQGPPDPGIHQGLAHRGASAGGPRLSAPTEPRLPQCVPPVGVQDQSQPTGRRSARDAPGRPLFCEMGTRGQHSPRQAARLPANTPCPRRAALQRPRRDAQACCPAPAIQRTRAHAHSRADAHVQVCTCTRALTTYTARTHTHWLLGSTCLRPPRIPVWNYSPPRLCWEGVPAQLQSLRAPRRPGITPGGLKDPEGCCGGVGVPSGLPQGPAAHLQKLTQVPGQPLTSGHPAFYPPKVWSAIQPSLSEPRTLETVLRVRAASCRRPAVPRMEPRHWAKWTPWDPGTHKRTGLVPLPLGSCPGVNKHAASKRCKQVRAVESNLIVTASSASPETGHRVKSASRLLGQGGPNNNRVSGREDFW